MAMFGTLVAVPMIFEMLLPSITPSFYGMNISEVPVPMGTFALGPMAGAVTGLVKILVRPIPRPTSTGFVGEFVNLCVGCSLALPTGFIYKFDKTKKETVIRMAVGTMIMTVVAVILNVAVMLPLYSHFMPLDITIVTDAATNPTISSA